MTGLELKNSTQPTVQILKILADNRLDSDPFGSLFTIFAQFSNVEWDIVVTNDSFMQKCAAGWLQRYKGTIQREPPSATSTLEQYNWQDE